ACRRDVNDVGAAILLAQPVIGGRDIKEKGAARLSRVRRLEKSVRLKIDDQKQYALVGERIDHGSGIVTRVKPGVFQRILLVEKFAGRVIVSNGKLGTGQAVVCGS